MMRVLASRPMCAANVGQRQTGTSSAALVGNNPIGQVIKETYGIGTDQTIRWGVLKSRVIPPAGQSFEAYRKQTEPERKQLRKEFAERLEVISFAERDRRRNIGIVMGGVTLAVAAWMVSSGVSTAGRLALVPTLFLSIGFLESARVGLCTESLAGAWDVDDRGLEYMPNKDVAQRIQKKVFGMYARGTIYSVLAMTLICKL